MFYSGKGRAPSRSGPQSVPSPVNSSELRKESFIRLHGRANVVSEEMHTPYSASRNTLRKAEYRFLRDTGLAQPPTGMSRPGKKLP
jgi:hypothetical protein